MARIFQTNSMGMADIKAALVNHPGEADLCVYRVSSRGMAHGDAFWYICRDRHDAQSLIYFCSRGMAQVKICFVGNHSAAGWKTDHPLKGRFGL
ncbi:MAG: DUF6150 family protein [Gammaproteobacteria bacterium]